MKKFYHHGQIVILVIIIGVATALLTAFFLHSLSSGTLVLTRLDVNDNTSFLDFYTALLGGILGGVITLAGVALTIMNSDKKHAEQLAIEYRPYLDAVKTEKDSETICVIDGLIGTYSREDAKTIDVDLMFSNRGRGILSGWNLETITSYNASIKSGDLFMSPGYEFYMKVRFYVDPLSVENGPIEVALNYNDEFDNQYIQKLHFTITTKVIREDEIMEHVIHFKDIGRQRRIR